MKSAYCLTINLGSPEEIAIEQLAMEIIALANSKSKVAHKVLPEDDPKVRQPDISLAKSVLGWEPRKSRREGLARTIQYFRTLST
jgi:dTDP-glucose 4,6-dehydratase